MNLRTTLVLVLLAVVGGAVWRVGPRLPPRIVPAPPVVADAGTLATLETLTPDRLTAIKVLRGNTELLSFSRGDKGGWVMPGRWPTRPAAVAELVERLTSLRSRFTPEPISAGKGLAKYGLDAPAYTVDVEAGKEKVRLQFGEGQEEDNPFFRPTYVRLDGKDEVVRLGPGLLAALGRPLDYYQKRQLFPTERKARSADAAEKRERLAATAVVVSDSARKDPGFTLSSAGGWHLSSPTRDRIDPDKRDALLEAFADLWAERFIVATPADAVSLAGNLCPGGALPVLTAAVGSPGWLLLSTGLDRPERTLAVRGPNGPAILLIGKVSDIRFRPPPPGARPGTPPLPPQEFRYAKLKDNAQLFEIKADKLKDVFVSAADLRDSKLARFANKDVRRVEVEHGKDSLVLFRDDKDRWQVEMAGKKAMLAEENKVSDLLDKLSGLTAQEKEWDGQVRGASLIGQLATPGPRLPALLLYAGRTRPSVESGAGTGLARVRLTIAEAAEAGDKDKKPKKMRVVTLNVVGEDLGTGRLLVKVDDWPSIHQVEGDVLPVVRRPALAYRGKLFDFALGDIVKLVVEQKDKKIALEQAGGQWRLIAPAAADVEAARVGQLTDVLSKLEPTEYVTEDPTAEDLKGLYGLTPSPLAVTVQVKDQLKTLRVGKKRDGKTDYFARLDGSPSVFVVGPEIHDTLQRNSLSYLPLDLWRTDPRDVQSVRVEKQGAAPFVLQRQGKNAWKLNKPFDAAALDEIVRPLVEGLAHPHAERYEAHSAADLKEYGLAEPEWRVQVTAKGLSKELLVGKTVKDGKDRYAKLADSPAIAVVRSDAVRNFDHSAIDLLDTLLLAVNLEAVQRVQSQQKDARLVLEHKGGAWKVVEAPGAPFTADGNAVNALGALLFNLRAERFAAYGDKLDLKKYGLDTPVATVTLTVATGAAGQPKKKMERTLELGGAVEGKPGYHYARLDRGAGVAVLVPADVRLLARTYLAYVDHKLLTFAAEKVTAIERQKGAETLELTKKDGEWQLVKPEAQRADDGAVGELVTQLASLRAASVAEYPLKDPKKYGLDAPFAVLTVQLTGTGGKPEKHTIALGKEVEGKKGQRYAKVDNKPVAAVLSVALVQRLAAGPLAFRNRDLAQFNDADRILLEHGRRRATFAKLGGNWTMTAPLESKVDHDQMEEFLARVAKLKADELVADKPEDLKPYGLETPAAHWRFQNEGKDVLDLLIGKAGPGSKRRYAKLGNGTLVFLLDADLAQRALGEFRSRTVWTTPLDAAQVETLRLTRGETTLVLKRAGAAWKLEGKPEVKLNAETVNDTVAALTGLKLARYAVDKGADFKVFGLEPPAGGVEAELAGRKMTLYLGHAEGASKRLYARAVEKDRSDVLVLSEEDSARLTRDVAALKKPLPKKPGPPHPLPPGFPGGPGT